MPKLRTTLVPNPDEVVTRRILGEELGKFRKEFKEEMMEDIREMFFQNNTLMMESFVTKQEWARDMDQIMGAIQSMREELAASLYQHQRYDYLFENHDKRLLTIERTLEVSTQVES